MSELRVNRDDVRAELEPRLEEGRALLAELDEINSEASLDAWSGNFQLWTDYNLTLLGKLLADQQLIDEYRRATAGTVAILDSDRLQVELPHRRMDLTRKLTALESLLKRLPLLDEPRAREGAPLAEDQTPAERNASAAIELLRTALGQIDDVVAAGHESAERTEWGLSTGLLFDKVFGLEHRLTSSYQSVPLTIPTTTTFTGDPATQLPRIRNEVYARAMEKRRGILRAAIALLESEGVPETSDQSSASSGQPAPRDVFVVHGRDSRLRDALFDLLTAFDLHPIEWSEAVAATGLPTPYVGDVLDAALSRAQAVVVLFSPDDEARLREPYRDETDEAYESELTGQARPNVLFEAGLSMGRAPDRVVLVQVGDIRPFSDVGGRHILRLHNASESRQQLAKRLQSAGCRVNLDGTRWHDAGDFSAPDLATRRFESGSVTDLRSQLAALADDHTTVKLLIANNRDSSGAQLLADTFELAGWQVNLNTTAQQPSQPARYFRGTEVTGFNGVLVDGVTKALQAAGFAEVSGTVQTLQVPSDNPKYPSARRSIRIMVGDQQPPGV